MRNPADLVALRRNDKRPLGRYKLLGLKLDLLLNELTFIPHSLSFLASPLGESERRQRKESCASGHGPFSQRSPPFKPCTCPSRRNGEKKGVPHRPLVKRRQRL